MTREEAIQTIESNRPSSGYTMLCEALDMAISALRAQQDTTLQEAYDAMARDLESRTKQVRRLQEENAELRARQENLSKVSQGFSQGQDNAMLLPEPPEEGTK